MRRLVLLFGFGAAATLVWACSSTPNTSDSGTDASNSSDAPTDALVKDAGTSDASSDGGAKDSAVDSGPMFTLTINDYLTWCAVTVNGGTVIREVFA